MSKEFAMKCGCGKLLFQVKIGLGYKTSVSKIDIEVSKKYFGLEYSATIGFFKKP